MKRREFITLVGGAAAWPLVVRAQQSAMPVIGFLDSRSPDTMAGRLRAFREGLKEAGYVEGENVAIEYRWAEGHNDRLPALAVGLVRRQVKVLVASAGTPSALAAKTATASLPIIFIMGNDPVKLGLVASLNRPGGNIAGVTVISLEVTAKRLELLQEMIPTAAIVALLVNPTSSYSEPEIREAQEASRTLGLRLHVLEASSERDIDAAFASLLELRASALLVSADPFFSSRRHQLVALAARYASPAIYAYRDFAEDGGPYELRRKHCRCVSPGGHLCRPSSQGRETRRPPGFAADQVRAGNQSQDREDTWPHRPANPARTRRRGDRVMKRRSVIGVNE